MADNLSIIRGVYDSFAHGDVPAVLGAFASEIHWTEAEGFPYGGIYTGPGEILENVFMRLGTEWDGFAAVPHDFVVQGDRVVALGRYSGRYKATGKAFSAPFAHVWTLRNGKAVTFQQYTDTALVQAALR
jgi:uncharacterized protein